MVEQFFTQTEWQGIQFSDLGVPLDPGKPATPIFYEAFYRRLMEVFPMPNDLPEIWQVGKRETAAAIATLVDQNDRLLSYGAGLGTWSSASLRIMGCMECLFVMSPRPPVTSIPKGCSRLLTHLCILKGGGQEFDVIIMVQVLYALERTDAIEVLQNLKQMIAPRGQLILFNTSPTFVENGEVDTRSLPARLRAAARNVPLLRKLARRLRNRPPGQEQGWGWERDNECVRVILNSAGFSDVHFQSQAGQAVVQARVGPPATL